MLETSFDAKSTSQNAVWQCFALAGPLKDTINSELLVRGAGGRLCHPAVSLAIGAWRMHAMSHSCLFTVHCARVHDTRVPMARACAWRARALDARVHSLGTRVRSCARSSGTRGHGMTRACAWRARAHGARERLTPACTLTRALLRTGARDARALLRAVVWHARARLD